MEVAAAGRSQRRTEVEQALERIRVAGFPALNIDLIYGLPGQTAASWLESLDAAMRFAPEELYLYPLYVRPLTGLGRHDRRPEDRRIELYRTGRELLLASGYEQISLRMFRRKTDTPSTSAPVYCCQEDGMIGIGCGARSYTRGLHYSSEYAVGARGVRAIIDDYIDRPREAFASAAYGFVLGAEEQRRRYLIQSLLQVEGLELAAYRKRFCSELMDDMPELRELIELNLAVTTKTHLCLTEGGMEQSDTIGPWLYSTPVQGRMESYELR
jgi:oxygen-independent coproporphyrinogen-3 oxidase